MGYLNFLLHHINSRTICLSILYNYAWKSFKYLCIFEYGGNRHIGAVSFSVHFAFVAWPNEKTHAIGKNLLENDIYYFRGAPMFMIAFIQEWPLRINFAYGNFVVIVSYGITLYSSWKVWKKLKDQSTNFSVETRKLHSQMTRTMVVQAIIPLFFILIPVGCAMNFTFAKINVPGLGMIFNIVCCWIPVANSFVTICTVKAYKRIVTSFIYKVVKILPNRMWQQQNTATVSAQATSSQRSNN